jgi:arginase
MNIQIIQVPYDSGHEHVRTGKGPAWLLDNDLDGVLKAGGHRVRVSRVRSDLPLPTENGTTFDVIRLLAQQVRSAVRDRCFPMILAGNCNCCVGATAGLDIDRLGVIWFDAHGDFNTPETTTTGFLDGMGLAMASGRCWRALLDTIPGFQPVADDCIVHVGSRDLDPQEKKMLVGANIPLIVADPADEAVLLTGLNHAITALKSRVDGVYLHIDMDVMDTGQGRPNHLAVPGGLHPRVVEAAIGIIKTHFTIASFDPAFDQGNSVLHAAIGLITSFVGDSQRLSVDLENSICMQKELV